MSDTIRCPKDCFDIQKDAKLVGEFLAKVPAAHTMETVKHPNYFGMLQARKDRDRLLMEGDFIKIMPVDQSWYMEVMVRARVPAIDQVITEVIHEKVFSIGDLPAGWATEYKGEHVRWVILYRGEEKDGGFVTEEAARVRIEKLASESGQSMPAPKAKPAAKKTVKSTEPEAAVETEDA